MSGSTNSKIKDQNKQVEKQYKSDKAFWEYTNYENKRKYEDAVQRTKLNQANLDAQAAFKDKIAEQQYDYESDIQKYQFQNEKKAYNRALNDYDQQVELNSLSGALAQEAEDRKIDEALLAKNFQMGDQDFILDKARFDTTRRVESNDRRVRFAQQNLTTDKAESASLRAYLSQKAANDRKQNEIKDKQLDNDITFIANKAGWDNRRADLKFNQAKAANFTDRIELMVKKEQAVGRARAAGREGLSAQREVTNALAEYGRATATLVDNMVFAKDDQTITKDVIKGTAKYETDNKNLDKQSLVVAKDQINKDEQRALTQSRYRDSKLDLAFNELKANADYDSDTARKELGFTERKVKEDKSKIVSTYKSAKLQYQANTRKIKLDEYAANMAAQGRVPNRPEPPPPLPLPLKTPRVDLPLPLEPTKAPKPIKGAIGKTSVWNDVGDVLNVGLQVAGLFI